MSSFLGTYHFQVKLNSIKKKSQLIKSTPPNMIIILINGGDDYINIKLTIFIARDNIPQYPEFYFIDVDLS
ncbi:TPA: hypothetical protein PWK54_005101 [Escherichia coli]|uniref:hypothetical protein n=1 Tax=Escherichia coli TaxID=562 RepID=UPI0022984901|nr:hypothetical protein [Escherichia coli]HCW2811144.1 hypothetical protein [Escherichia coli]HDL0260843.1 hypothetical protein [Escherichia coli]HDL0323309.1 hypothetical protein [Escherichia coli]